MADSYPDLLGEEKDILRFIVKSSQAQSVNMIKNKLNISEYRVRKVIEKLEDKHLIRKIGNGPSTKYIVGIESVELLTQLQIMMDVLKKRVT